MNFSPILDTIPIIRGQVEPEWLRKVIPNSLRDRELLGVTTWQWFGLLVIIFAGIVLDFAVRTVGTPILFRIARKVDARVQKKLVRRFVQGLGLLAAALLWLVTVRLLDFTGDVRDVARMATGFYAVLTGTLLAFRFVDLTADMALHLSARTETKADDIMVPLVRKTLKVFIFAVGFIYGAQNLNVNIVPLITGLGIGGLAFAFAAKDTIENFFGSIAVILDRPFEVGDWVVVDDTEGTVEELGFRSTRIRTFYNSQVTVPNATLVRARVDNLGRRQYRRWKTTLGVQYDTPPEKLLAFTGGIRELVRQHPYTRKDFYQVWCNDFGTSSFNILLYIFFEVPDWPTELRERERFFVDVVRLADRLGVQFAFPTRTLHLYKEEHKPHESQYDIPRGSHDEEARKTGVTLAEKIVAERDWKKEAPAPVNFDEATSRGS